MSRRLIVTLGFLAIAFMFTPVGGQERTDVGQKAAERDAAKQRAFWLNWLKRDIEAMSEGHTLQALLYDEQAAECDSPEPTFPSVRAPGWPFWNLGSAAHHTDA